DVFRLIYQSNVKKSFITHLSNRYNLEDIEEINRALKEMKDTPNFEFVKDFDTFKF
ncbi:MAG: ribonuclease Z, partial [Staphylococcus sp.]|nr:ribonuclease Z [Staphylococcus sp.]